MPKQKLNIRNLHHHPPSHQMFNNSICVHTHLHLCQKYILNTVRPRMIYRTEISVYGGINMHKSDHVQTKQDRKASNATRNNNYRSVNFQITDENHRTYVESQT